MENTWMKPLSGRIALITGASRTIGIGAAICRQLANAGADIAFTHFLAYDQEQYDSPADGPRQLRAELLQAGVRVHDIAYDLSKPGIAGPLLDDVEAALGQIDILVNNAAYSTHDAWDTLTEESLDMHMAVNLRATAMLTVEFARRFTKGSGGRVINFSSGQHLGPMPRELAYASSKGAIIAFTRSISPDLARLGITANVINPGPTDTGWMTDELKAALLESVPSGRIGQPEDAARLVGWLASDDARWITGQVINSEGGLR
jgi:3-oxoacyl-[acyl-carrier protein] reductase